MNHSLGSITIIFAIAVWGVGAANPASAQCLANELAKLTASDAAAGDIFGESVSISGDVAVVDGGSGAYVYRFNGSKWTQEAKLTASDAQNFWSVSISGDTVVSGWPGDDTGGNDAGAAWVFEKPKGGWVDMTETAKLIASDASAGDWFGFSVSISGDLAVVGARQDDDNGFNSGSAYIFRFNGSTWVEEQKLLASDGAASDSFGSTVSISGNVAIIGARGADPGGSAFVYRYNRLTGSWDEEQELTAFDGAQGTGFGASVSVSGDVAVVGADYTNDAGHESGSAYVFRFDGNTWKEEAQLIASDAMEEANFGNAVSISGGVALIGAWTDSDAGCNWCGSAYVYQFDGAQWIEEAKLIASDGAAVDLFGSSVATSGAVALIGAWANDDAGSLSGSAYVFTGLSDCNDNGTLDLCDIADGTSTDTNGNGIPDECECPWDLDGSGNVGVSDLLGLLGSWGPCPPKGDCPGDFDNSGDVGVKDLLFLLGNWGPCI